MDKIARVQYLKEMLTELEDELEKDLATEVNTNKAKGETSYVGNATVNDIDEFELYKCEGDDKNCILIICALAVAIVVACCLLLTYA